MLRRPPGGKMGGDPEPSACLTWRLCRRMISRIPGSTFVTRIAGTRAGLAEQKAQRLTAFLSNASPEQSQYPCPGQATRRRDPTSGNSTQLTRLRHQTFSAIIVNRTARPYPSSGAHPGTLQWSAGHCLRSSCPPFSRRRTAPTQKAPDASQDDKKTCYPNTLHPRDLPLERVWQLLPAPHALLLHLSDSAVLCPRYSAAACTQLGSPGCHHGASLCTGLRGVPHLARSDTVRTGPERGRPQ